MTASPRQAQRPARHRRRLIPRFLPFYKPPIDGAETREALEAIASGWLTTGPRVARFETEIARLAGARHAVALNSCTAALHLALAAIRVGPGDEVITSPYTFAATGEAILYLGARPVFVDIDSRTLNLDPERLARAVTRRTRAIVPIHVAGLPCDMRGINAVARRKRLRVIDDAAHAIGAAVGRRPVGSLADMTCFSFYATKNLTTGEGGMVVLDDARLAARVRLLSLHGLSRDAWKRYTRSGTWKYDVVDLGFKYNMTDVAAAIGLAQARKFRRLQERRRRIAALYTRLLDGEEAFETPPESPGTTHAWHLYILRLRPDVLGLGRDALIDRLKERGIGTSVHFQPLHLFSYYRRRFGHRPGDFPHTEEQSARALSLPFYPDLTRADVERVVAVLRDLARRHRR